MNIARMAVKVYPRHALTDKHTTHHLRREWIKKIELLGDRWLLAKAMQGVLANPDVSKKAAKCEVTAEQFQIAVARSAYAVADELLEARNAK